MAISEFVSPVGRLVQGDPCDAQTKNQQGQPYKTLDGRDTQRYFMALAYAKNDPAFPAFYQQMVAAGRAAWPQLFDAAGNCTHPRFSWKLIDGDGVDDNGKPNAQKEGFAGHWVIKFQTSFAPKVYYTGRVNEHERITEKGVCKRGYYYRVAGSFDTNKNQNKPGIHINMNGVEMVAQGPVITSGPDMGAIFGAAPVGQLPAGAMPMQHAPQAAAGLPGALPGMPMASPAPMAAMPGQMMPAAPLGSPGMMPGLPMGSPASVAPGLPPLNAGAPAALPAMTSPINAPPAPLAVAPNPGFLAGPGGVPGTQPQMMAAPGALPGMPMQPQMQAAAPAGPQLRTITMDQYNQYRAQGYDDAALRAHGMIA